MRDSTIARAENRALLNRTYAICAITRENFDVIRSDLSSTAIGCETGWVHYLGVHEMTRPVDSCPNDHLSQNLPQCWMKKSRTERDRPTEKSTAKFNNMKESTTLTTRVGGKLPSPSRFSYHGFCRASLKVYSRSNRASESPSLGTKSTIKSSLTANTASS